MNSKDVYRLNMIQKLVGWDWSKTTWNQYTMFFDDAITILSDNDGNIDGFNDKEKEFIDKYGLTPAQAEIKIYLHIVGGTRRILVRPQKRTYSRMSRRNLTRSVSDRAISWLDMQKDLRDIKIWVQERVKEVAEDLGVLSI